MDPDKNTCTVRVVADHVFYSKIGQSQESTVRYVKQPILLCYVGVFHTYALYVYCVHVRMHVCGHFRHVLIVRLNTK